MTFQVHDLASKNLVTIPATASVVEAQSLMEKNKIHHLVVTNDKQVVGVVSEEILSFREPSCKVVDLVSTSDVTVLADRPLREVVDVLAQSKSGAVLVTEDSVVMGILTTNDLLKILARYLGHQQEAFWGEALVNSAYSTPVRTVLEVLSNTGI